MDSFEDLFNNLNTEQQRAVNTIDGPVMVVAGPGTGKTQILATRILNIISKTDTQAQNILCLTYTDAGAIAMQKRLGLFMGASAFNVPIYTFHGLCNKIIQENSEKFSRTELRVMDDLDKIDLIQGIVEQLPANSLLKSYQDDAQQIRRDLSKMWNLMQSESIELTQIEAWTKSLLIAENFKLAFPNLVYKKPSGENKVGDIKASEYKKMSLAWKKGLEAAKLFATYKELKKKKGLYEFSDMLEWVCEGFKNDPDLLLDSQERYQYILVDEYQDTSGLQNQILHQLISFWGDTPNCFVVGDDDQSVYAFQGAKVSNMLDFAKKYEQNLQTFVLTENYRSSQPILDMAKKVIENNSQRLVYKMQGLSKELIAAGKNCFFDPITPNIKQFKNEFHEAVGIAEEIKLLIESGEKANEIAVLYPFNKHAKILVDTFDEMKLPFVIHRSVDILNETTIQHLLVWIEYLSLEIAVANSGEHLIYKLLISPLYDISSFEVNQLSVAVYAKKTSSRNQGIQYHWRDHIAEIIKLPQQTELFGEPPSVALKALWINIEKWIKEASWLTVPQLIQQFYSEGGYLAYALKSNDTEWTLEVLQTFLQFSNRQNEKNPFQKPHEFLATVKKMLGNNIAIPLEKRIGNAQGVQFITTHSSKGLEFEHVFVTRLNPKEWEENDAGRMPFRIMKLIQGKEIQLHNQTTAEEDLEERRRLFYVALTRAKKTLHISFNQLRVTPTKISEQTASLFVYECADEITTTNQEISLQNLLFVQQAILQKTSKPKLLSDKLDWILDRTTNFTFSPSSLYSILECGLKFYFTRIVRVPDAPHPATSYGTAMHAAMKIWVDTWTNDKKWLTQSAIIQIFEKEMYRQRHGFNEKQFSLRMQQGKDILPDYYAARSTEFRSHQLVLSEKTIKTVIDGVPIAGNLDKIVFDGKNVTVVDYKTGKPENSIKKSQAPGVRSIEKLPPSYWFQIGIYQLMINNLPGKDWKCNLGVIDCIEKDENGEFPHIKIYYTEEHNQLLKSWIQAANAQLQSLSFMSGCGKADCYWCDFAKNTHQIVYLPEIEKEDMEA